MLSMFDSQCDIGSFDNIDIIIHFLLLVLPAVLLLISWFCIDKAVLSGVWLSESSGVVTLPKDDPI